MEIFAFEVFFNIWRTLWRIIRESLMP